MVELLPLKEKVVGSTPTGRTMLEKPPTNRLVEDKKFYDSVRGQILEEIGYLSKTFDDQMVEMGYRITWGDRIEKLRKGEKLPFYEREVWKIVLEVAQKRNLSDTEREYLLNNIFTIPKKLQTDDD